MFWKYEVEPKAPATSLWWWDAWGDGPSCHKGDCGCRSHNFGQCEHALWSCQGCLFEIALWVFGFVWRLKGYHGWQRDGHSVRGICPALCSAGWFVDTADVFFPALTFARRCCALRAKQMMRRCFAKRGSTPMTFQLQWRLFGRRNQRRRSKELSWGSKTD